MPNLYKYTNPQNPVVSGTCDETTYLKMRQDRVFKNFSFEPLETENTPIPQLKPPSTTTKPRRGKKQKLRSNHGI